MKTRQKKVQNAFSFDLFDLKTYNEHNSKTGRGKVENENVKSTKKVEKNTEKNMETKRN